MSEHQELKLCIGVKQAAGDSSSAETGYEEITLLGASTGLQLVPGGEGWIPQIAQSKGGIWRDGPYTPGRTPDALPVQNVIETMKCQITAGTHQEVYRYIEALNRFITRARDYLTSYSNIYPVFLHWWAYGASGPQFAVLYNIDAAIGDISNVSTEDPTVSVTMTLEREPAWRWQVPPGANPKLWALRNQTTISLNDLTLLGTSNDLVNASIQNRYEINPASEDLPLSKNFVDVPAALVPGDAPALVEVATVLEGALGSKLKRLFIGRNSKPTTIVDRDGLLSGYTRQFLLFNAGDGIALSADLSKAAATYGNYSNGSTVTKYHIAGALTASSNNLYYHNIRPNLLRGKYAAFIRCRQTSGSAGDVSLRIDYGHNVTVLHPATPYVAMPLCTPTSGRGEYLPLYMGEINLPEFAPGVSDDDGRGLYADSMQLYILIKNNIASGKNIQILDLVLVPLDETTIVIDNQPASDDGITAQTGTVILDNTGYLGRQTITPIATTPFIDSVEVRGDLTLAPNTNNRLHFFNTSFENSPVTCEFSGSTGLTFTNMQVGVNIVPRSYGPRTD